MEISKRQLDLMASIYDAILDPKVWPEVLGRLTDDLGARAVNFLIADYNLPEVQVSAASSVFDEALLEEYHRDYAESERPLILKMANYPAGQFVTIRDLSTGIGVYEELPSVCWLREKHGISGRSSLRLNDSVSWLDLITFNYAENHGEMTAEERAIASLYLPHLAKAVQVIRPFQLLRVRFQAVLSALDRFHIGVFVISKTGSVILSNLEADRILDVSAEFYVDPAGYLRLSRNSDQAKLTKAVKSASATAEARNVETGAVFSIERDGAQEPFLVEVSPFHDNSIADSGVGYALLFVIDPNNRNDVSILGMEQLFGLTKAESETFQLLVVGHNIASIAEQRNVKPSTIRSHIKSLFTKTNTNRQADLVRLALCINLPIDPIPDGQLHSNNGAISKLP